MTLEHRRIDTNGIYLHCALGGPEDGPLVIMLHGFPEYWRGWHRQIGPLAAAGYRVCVPDQRGYNLSDKPKGLGNYRLDVLAADVVGLIDALGAERAHIVSHDWGAAVAWYLGCAHADRVNRIVICNVPHLFVMERALKSSLKQLRKSWYMFFFQLPWIPERGLLGRNPPMAKALRDTNPDDAFPPHEMEALIEAWNQPGAATGMLNWYRAAARRPLKWPNEGRVTPPLLIIWGRNDIALTDEMAEESLAWCDDGRLEFLDAAGHFVQHTRPDEVTRLVLGFLE